MIDYITWYEAQVERGQLPDKDGAYHYVSQQEYRGLTKEDFEEFRGMLRGILDGE